MFVWITLVLVLTGEYICEAQQHSTCDDRFTSCYTAWGYSLDHVAQPDRTIWDMDVFTNYCRSDNEETFSTCFRGVMSSCQIFSSEQDALLQKMVDITDSAIDYMCSNIDVIETNRACLDAADRDLTQCTIDSDNRAEAEIMERAPNGEIIPFEVINDLNQRSALDLTNCVDGVLTRRCNREVAIPFKNFYYAGYMLYEDL